MGSMLAEKDRALEMAEREREKAASAIRNEQQRALDRAASEREAAASALREQLTERIATGDANLREHISAQVQQITQMIDNAERLSLARFDGAQTAIDKAESATEKRFEGVNEFRLALTDLSRTMAAHTDLTNLIDRTNERFDLMRETVDRLSTRMDLREGQEAGARLTTGAMVAGLTVLVGVLGLIVVAANYLIGT